MTQNIKEYINLIDKFVSGALNVSDFENAYWKKFLAEPAGIESEIFDQLDWLFASIDCYTNDEEMIKENPKFNISENQLRQNAAKVLTYLNQCEAR